MSLAPVPDPSPSSLAGQTAAPRYGEPFQYIAPENERVPLVMASPHSGTRYPAAMRAALCVPLIDLQRTEDAFVDDLIWPSRTLGAGVLRAQYARGFIDLNRDPLELDPDMFDGPPPRKCGLSGPRVEAGLGCIPRVGARGHSIYHTKLDPAEGEARLADVHGRYHDHLASELTIMAQAHGAAYLIDWHSMPSRQPGRKPLAEIVLGDRFGSSCSGRLTSLVERRFRKLGYTVARNAPYAGGYTTLRYGRPRRGLHALQIEIRRDLYMDEAQVERNENYGRMRADISEVAKDLVQFVSRQTRARLLT